MISTETGLDGNGVATAARAPTGAEETVAPAGSADAFAEGIRAALAAAANPVGPVSPLSDLRVTRDAAGKLEPMKRMTLWEGHIVRFLPLTYRDRAKYRLDVQGLTELDDEDRLAFLREHMIEPSFADVESLDDFGWNTIDDLLLTVQTFSRDRRRNELPEPLADDERPSDVAGKE